MCSISEKGLLANLPAEQLMTSLQEFVMPILAHLPKTRLRQVGVLAIRGVFAAQSPVLTEMARGGQPDDTLNWPPAKQFHRFVAYARFDHGDLLKGLHGVSLRTVAHYPWRCLVVAIDPVNFEKLYTGAMEEGLHGPEEHAPRAAGRQSASRPGIRRLPPRSSTWRLVISYANGFSYQTADFLSENLEIYRAIRLTRALFPGTRLCFVGDSELDDQKIMFQVARINSQFIF